MKQCPNCKTTYTDDSLQFCLADGANLIVVPDAAETVQMSFGSQPMQINLPPDSAPTVYTPPPASQNQPVKKVFVLMIVGVVCAFLLLAAAGIAGFFFYRQTDNKNSTAIASPTATVSPNASSTVAATNDETERLKEEMANLKKQMENQKNQKPNVPTVQPPNQKLTTARANSPRDGFLALRSEPNSETGYRIAQIPHGATLTVLGCPKPSNIGKIAGHWCQVIYEGQSGWAFDAFMSF